MANQLETLTRLFDFGFKLYSTVEEVLTNTTPEQLELIKAWYAAFHGLSSQKDVEDHIQEPRFCKDPDIMPVRQGICKWQTKDVSFSVIEWPNVFSKQEYEEAAIEAMNRWAKVCGLRPQFLGDDPRAMIVLGKRAIDGPYGVLAESELPCGRVKQCRQWYDTGEQWAIFTGSGPGGKRIDLVRVMAHELGHALGMNHIGAGNLLAPVYSANIWLPQKGDIAEMVGRYGTPAPAKPSDPQPPTPGTDDNPEDFTTIRFKGPFTAEGYRVTKLLTASPDVA